MLSCAVALGTFFTASERKSFAVSTTSLITCIGPVSNEKTRTPFVSRSHSIATFSFFSTAVVAFHATVIKFGNSGRASKDESWTRARPSTVAIT